MRYRSYSFNSLIDTSSSSSSLAHVLYKVLVTHCQALKLGKLAHDTYTANNILNLYSKIKLSFACKLFDEIPQSNRDIVTWNTMITAYVNSGNLDTAWELRCFMTRNGLQANEYTFGSILKGVASACRLDLGRQIHSLIAKIGYEANVYPGSALLDMYAKCGKVEDAYAVFQSMPERNSVSWNATIAGFVQVGDRGTAFGLLSSMEKEKDVGVTLDDATFSPLLTLLDDNEFYKSTMQLHCKIIKLGLDSDNTVCNAAITSYSECGSLEDAEKVFDGSVGARDLVTWNSMLAAFLAHNQEEVAFQCFLDMQCLGFVPDIYTYTSVISACSEKAHKNLGRSLHGMVIKRGLEGSVSVSNSVIAMYLKSSDKSVEDALEVFRSMESRDRVSWTSILTGFSQIGFSEDALKLFGHMRSLLVEIDDFSFSAVLRCCSDLATLRLGQQLHALTIKSGFESNDFVASSLIFMYSKCGIIEDAQKSFEETAKDHSITWNSIMFAYAQHGQGDVALDLFFLMREKKVKLDHITFVAVLTACSHIGLVDQGRKFLKSMALDYGISPQMEHYACAVDLFGRAGRLDEAKSLIESMPFKPDLMVWKTFLGACRACGNIELATQVAGHLLDLDPEEHCTYVILSNMYGHLKRWDERASVTKLMRERKVRKVPGWSWIEISNEVHTFNAKNCSHPLFEEIYQLLEELMEEIKWLESTAGLDSLEYLMHNVDRVCMDAATLAC